MKTLKIMLLVTMFTQNCFAQEIKTSKINFFDFIKPAYGITPRDCRLANNQTISYATGIFDVYSTNKNGTGTFFVVPKKEFGLWKKEDKSEWKREDVIENNKGKIQNIKDFLSSPIDTLFAYFDIHVFYVKQEDMAVEGTVMSDDGELLDDYYVKDDAIIYTYLYENGMWVEINNESIGDDGTRTYGIKVIEKILQERFRK